MFKKAVDKIIANEVKKRNDELASMDLTFNQEKSLIEIKSKKLKEDFENEKNKINDNLKDWEKYSKAKQEQLEKELAEKQANIIKLANEKLDEVNQLRLKLDNETKEISRLRINAEVEQKRLWERLDILKDNLNTEQLWNKLWECAFSKSFDVTWELMKKEVTHIAEVSKQEGIELAKKQAEKEYQVKIDKYINSCMEKVNIPLIFKRKEEAYKNFLNYQRVKDEGRENYYKGQLDLIAEIYNEK